MNKLAWTIILALSVFGCHYSRTPTVNETVMGDAVLIYEGKVVGKAFVNKIGKENPKIVDLYFEANGETYFIKFIDSKVTRDEMLNYVDRKMKIKAAVDFGLWDTNDPNVQSRVGKYVVIYEIVE